MSDIDTPTCQRCDGLHEVPGDGDDLILCPDCTGDMHVDWIELADELAVLAPQLRVKIMLLERDHDVRNLTQEEIISKLRQIELAMMHIMGGVAVLQVWGGHSD
jgi:hypothetical protein